MLYSFQPLETGGVFSRSFFDAKSVSVFFAMTNPTFLNESCLQWSFGNKFDETTIRATLAAFCTLNDSAVLKELGVTDVVPAYNKLAVHFSGSESRHSGIKETVDHLLSNAEASSNQPGEMYTLTVDYSGEDLSRVARHCGLSVDELIARHTAPEYLVAMIGFQPHFPYLFGLDPLLETPRLETPRVLVPAGSVAIGGAQTGIYPAPSPGGWNLIGLTDPAALFTLQPGDRVRFVSQEVSA